MSSDPLYAPAKVWDGYFATRTKTVGELNPDGWWVASFLPFLLDAKAQLVLEVGCGMVGDAVQLARQGFHVTALDYSEVALKRARARAVAAGVGRRR